MIVTSPTRATALTLAGLANNPFFAWENLGSDATLTGSAAAPDGSMANAVSGTTYDYFTPANGAGSIEFRAKFPTAKPVTFAGLAAHNLGDIGASVSVGYSSNNGATWTDGGAGFVNPEDNRPIGWRMSDDVNSNFWRVLVTGGSSTRVPSLGVVFFGEELIMPTRIFQGFQPILTPTEVALQSNVSIGNHLLGSSVVFSGSTLSAQFSHLKPTFVRDQFLEFQRSFNEGRPCFFGWRPEKYSRDLHYGWRDGAIVRPDQNGPKDYMSADIEMRCHDG